LAQVELGSLSHCLFAILLNAISFQVTPDMAHAAVSICLISLLVFNAAFASRITLDPADFVGEEAAAFDPDKIFSAEVGASMIQAHEALASNVSLSPGPAGGSACSMAWLNVLLARIWPHTTAAIWEIVRTTINPKLKTQLPRGFRDMQIQKFEMKPPPTFGPIETIPTENGLKLKMRVTFKNTEPIIISQSSFTVGVKSLSFQGDLVMHLAPLIASRPVIGGIRAYFIDPPEVDVEFSNMAALAHLPGIAGIVRGLIASTLASKVVLPNVVGIPLATEEQGVPASTFAAPTPIGLVRATVLRAKDLTGKDWHLFRKSTSDAYVRIAIADQSWHSPVVKNSVNPEWSSGNSQDFVVVDKEQTLDVGIFDEDFSWAKKHGVGKGKLDDEIGQAALSNKARLTVAYIQTHGKKSDDYTLKVTAKNGKDAGTLLMKLQWYKYVKCASSANGVVFGVKVSQIVLPATVSAKASAMVTIAGLTKSTPVGKRPNSASKVYMDIVRRCVAQNMKAPAIAHIIGLPLEKVQKIMRQIGAVSGEYVGGVQLEIDSQLYFPNRRVDLLGDPTPMVLSIRSDTGDELAQATYNLNDMDLLNGVGSRNGCQVERSVVLRSGPSVHLNNIVVVFSVQLFTLE